MGGGVGWTMEILTDTVTEGAKFLKMRAIQQPRVSKTGLWRF